MSLITNDLSATIATPAVAERRDAAVSAAGAKPAANKREDAQDAAEPGTPRGSLAEAVKTLNERYATQRTDLKFTIDTDSGKTVVAVVDAQDGTVLRQIPSEEALRIAHTLTQNRGALIQRVA